MKIRLVLLSLLGIAAYIVLASYHSRVLKDTPPAGDHQPAAVTAPQPAKSLAPQEHTAPARPEADHPAAAAPQVATLLPEAAAPGQPAAPAELAARLQPL